MMFLRKPKSGPEKPAAPAKPVLRLRGVAPPAKPKWLPQPQPKGTQTYVWKSGRTA